MCIPAASMALAALRVEQPKTGQPKNAARAKVTGTLKTEDIARGMVIAFKPSSCPSHLCYEYLALLRNIMIVC